MKILKVGKLYKGLNSDFSQNASSEFIFQVLDIDFEHHKAYHEFKIIPIIPDHFDLSNIGLGRFDGPLWVRSAHIEKCEELPENHTAYILYAKKTT